MQPNTDNNANDSSANTNPDDTPNLSNDTFTSSPSAEPASAPEQTSSPTPEPAPTSAKSKSSKTTTIILSCVLALLAIGAATAIGFTLLQPQSNPGSTENTDNTDDNKDKQETGELEVEVEEIGTAEVEDGKFTIKDEKGKTIAEDEETEINGILSCETLEDDIRTSARCIVSTAEGEGIYVYYTDVKVLKFSESNN